MRGIELACIVLVSAVLAAIVAGLALQATAIIRSVAELAVK